MARCPLLMMGGVGREPYVTDCREESCAWWDGQADACAVLSIARATDRVCTALENIAETVLRGLPRR